MGRRGLPDRWINYSPLGERIAGTSFIAFKVPLKEALVRNLPQHERFTPQVLVESVPNIGLVIDLTNTDRYYDRQDILGQGIRYEKIFCRGHEIPSPSVVDNFFSAVDKFVEYRQTCSGGDDKLIGVHCTHGLNRTGYLVCRYMIRRLGFSPEEAIAAFEKARGYPMERQEYLQSLREDGKCLALADPIVNEQNRDGVHDGTDHQTSHFSHKGNASSSAGFSLWTDGAASSHSQDTRTHSFKKNSDSEKVNHYQRFPVNAKSDGPNVFSRSQRADNSSWRPQNTRADDYHSFTNSFRGVRMSGHPYRSELGTYFDPKEHVGHDSRAVSRRFGEPEYEESSSARRHGCDYQPRSLSDFQGDSRSRQPSPWRHHHNKQRHYFNHSV